jgi:hypothetical protein
MIVMKKVFAILFACLILLSGMHFTVATHYCCGEIAATKVSFSGSLASCGMITDVPVTSEGTSISTRCCENEVFVYAVESNFAPSVFHANVTQALQDAFLIPESTFRTHGHSIAIQTNVSPPDHYSTSGVSIADICIFRI